MATSTAHSVNLADAMVMTPPPMVDYLVVAPLVIGFVFGALCLMTRKNTGRQPFIAITGLVAAIVRNVPAIIARVGVQIRIGANVGNSAVTVKRGWITTVDAA